MKCLVIYDNCGEEYKYYEIEGTLVELEYLERLHDQYVGMVDCEYEEDILKLLNCKEIDIGKIGDYNFDLIIATGQAP